METREVRAKRHFEKGYITQSELDVELHIAKLVKTGLNDEYLKFGVEAWDNGNHSLALAVFEDGNYHGVAELIFKMRGNKR